MALVDVKGSLFPVSSWGAVVSLAAGFVWSLRPRGTYRVKIRMHDILFGTRAVPIAELRDCAVVGKTLVVDLSGKRSFATPELDQSPSELSELADAIRARIMSKAERKEYARKHMAALREREALTARTSKT